MHRIEPIATHPSCHTFKDSGRRTSMNRFSRMTVLTAAAASVMALGSSPLTAAPIDNIVVTNVNSQDGNRLARYSVNGVSATTNADGNMWQTSTLASTGSITYFLNGKYNLSLLDIYNSNVTSSTVRLRGMRGATIEVSADHGQTWTVLEQSTGGLPEN